MAGLATYLSGDLDLKASKGKKKKSFNFLLKMKVSEENHTIFYVDC